jgi:hypothetical protein
MRLESWAFIKDYLSRGVPGTFPVKGHSGIFFIVGPRATSLALHVPCNGAVATEPSPYQELKITDRRVDGRQVVELATATNSLFEAFYLLATAICDLIEDQHVDPVAAIQRALATFGELLRKRSLMSESAQLGLFGELGLLIAFLDTLGAGAFSSWLGPMGERHDFRIGAFEIEVKTTMLATRQHTIHGLSQLAPSPERELFLLSLQYERAGFASGASLPDRINAVRKRLSNVPDRASAFDRHLEKCGYKNEDEAFYSGTLQLRTPPCLVPVDAHCPKITEHEMALVMTGEIRPRLLGLEYVIDVTGLGVLQGTPEFSAILPGVLVT